MSNFLQSKEQQNNKLNLLLLIMSDIWSQYFYIHQNF
jgi:hypothetical protein